MGSRLLTRATGVTFGVAIGMESETDLFHSSSQFHLACSVFFVFFGIKVTFSLEIV